MSVADRFSNTISVEGFSFDDLLSLLLNSEKCDDKEFSVLKNIKHKMETKQNNCDDLENLLHLAKPRRYKNIVELLINTLKMVGEEFKMRRMLVDQKIKCK